MTTASPVSEWTPGTLGDYWLGLYRDAYPEDARIKDSMLLGKKDRALIKTLIESLIPEGSAEGDAYKKGLSAAKTLLDFVYANREGLTVRYGIRSGITVGVIWGFRKAFLTEMAGQTKAGGLRPVAQSTAQHGKISGSHILGTIPDDPEDIEIWTYPTMALVLDDVALARFREKLAARATHAQRKEMERHIEYLLKKHRESQPPATLPEGGFDF